MRVVIALDERPDETPLARVPALLDLRGAEVLLVHVLDPSPVDAWSHAAGHHLLRTHGPHAGAARMQQAGRTEGERILRNAAAVAAAWGVALRTQLLEGSPKHEIRALIDRDGADALVVFVRGREVGPKSIHPEARFLIDHAACSVLVVKE